MKQEQNNLTPEEVTVIQMALDVFIEDNEIISKDVKYPFTPEARTAMREMLTAAKSAHQKIAKASGHMVKLDPYVDGDEKEFLTKES